MLYIFVMTPTNVSFYIINIKVLAYADTTKNDRCLPILDPITNIGKSQDHVLISQ